jgi:hypothetical protein
VSTRGAVLEEAPAHAVPARRRGGPLRWLRRHALQIYGVLAFVYIFTPIAYVTVFSFNQEGRTTSRGAAFTIPPTGLTRAEPPTCAPPWANA